MSIKIDRPIEIKARAERHLLREPFIISRYSFTHSLMMVVELSCDGFIGRGESEPHEYDQDILQDAVDFTNNLAKDFQNGMRIETLNQILPAGPIRNAIDCALWDLAAKISGKRIWEIANLPEPKPLPTVYTLSIGEPENMAQKAIEYSHWSRFKIKLGGVDAKEDIARVRAIRNARKDAKLIVDANGGWDLQLLKSMTGQLADLGVLLIEQPLLSGQDNELIDFQSPVPLCADESCLDRKSLDFCQGRYQYINIKLDKTGGFTEALALSIEAQKRGFGIMFGCMAGTSLAMAPAHIIAQAAEFIDLDGPMLLAQDRPHGMKYQNGQVFPPSQELWG